MSPIKKCSKPFVDKSKGEIPYCCFDKRNQSKENVLF